MKADFMSNDLVLASIDVIMSTTPHCCFIIRKYDAARLTAKP